MLETIVTRVTATLSKFSNDKPHEKDPFYWTGGFPGLPNHGTAKCCWLDPGQLAVKSTAAPGRISGLKTEFGVGTGH